MNKFKVSHFPQIPCEPYEVEVETLKEAFVIKQTLAYYDLFLYNNNHRVDYSSVQTAEYWNEEEKEWQEWYNDDEGMDVDEWAEFCKWGNYEPVK